MKRRHLRLVLAVVMLAAATIVWAQGSGGPIGTMDWASGYPKESGTMPPTILGQGTYSFPSGWSATGRISALLPADETDEYYAYEGTISFGGTWNGTVSAYLPPGEYTVLAEANLTDGSGGSEVVLAEIASATVSGQVKKVNPGKVTVTKISDANGAIQASGTFQVNNGFTIKLASFKALAIPLTFFGNFDGTRKAVPAVPTVNPVAGTWTVTIPNVQAGKFWVLVGAEFFENANPSNVQRKAGSKTVTVD